MFQAQAFGRLGERELPRNEGWYASVHPHASLIVLQLLALLLLVENSLNVRYDPLFVVGSGLV